MGKQCGFIAQLLISHCTVIPSVFLNKHIYVKKKGVGWGGLGIGEELVTLKLFELYFPPQNLTFFSEF